MDQRFRHLAVVRARLAELEDDLSAGEPERLSFLQRRLCNHIIWCDAMAEELERRFTRGEQIELSQFAYVVSVMNQLSRTVGIARRAKEVKGIREVLGQAKTAA
jgi:hypothetical protein